MNLLIKNGYVVTVDNSRRVFDGGYVSVDEDGRIAGVGPASDTPDDSFQTVIDARGMIVVPGLMNLHQHPWMSLFKGLADGMLLEPWVFDFVQPCLKAMTLEDLKVSAYLSALEMVRTGTTLVLNHDLSFYADNYEPCYIEPMAEVGIRQVFAKLFQCRTEKLPDYPFSAKEASQAIGSLVDKYHGTNDGLTRLALVLECNAHHTELGKSSDELVLTGHGLAKERNLSIVAHMTGGTLSMEMGFTRFLRQTGRRDVAYLKSLGVLDHRWLLKHGIHFSDDDIATIQQHGCHAIYTPTSESIRGGGLGRWANIYRAGINAALGSDGPAVDYSVDMVEQMKACMYLQNVQYWDPTVMSPERVLEMATINAARALGLENELGSIETGKRADLAVFDLRDVHHQVIHNPLYNFICCARGADAHSVIVNGKTLLHEGRFTQFGDVDGVIKEASARGRRIAGKTGLDKRAQPIWPDRNIIAAE